MIGEENETGNITDSQYNVLWRTASILCDMNYDIYDSLEDPSIWIFHKMDHFILDSYNQSSANNFLFGKEVAQYLSDLHKSERETANSLDDISINHNMANHQDYQLIIKPGLFEFYKMKRDGDLLTIAEGIEPVKTQPFETVEEFAYFLTDELSYIDEPASQALIEIYYSRNIDVNKKLTESKVYYEGCNVLELNEILDGVNEFLHNTLSITPEDRQSQLFLSKNEEYILANKQRDILLNIIKQKQ